MNVLIGIIFICISTFVGHNISLKYVKRKKFYLDFNTFNKTLTTELNFSKSTLKSIFSNFENKNGDFYSYFSGLYDNENKKINLEYLSNDEKQFIKDYFLSISDADSETLKNYVGLSGAKINDCLKLATNDEKKYRTLYLKLGFLIGLIALIVLL